MKIYSVGIYARLSVEGEKNESIETQIEIARAYIQKQKDMVIFGCYTDMGRTGRNFEREGFERMMRDVRLQRIDCIIVKDLSRFGRNHIETGNYMEKIFPFLGVRFIAVTDNFDSMREAGLNEPLGINLKNLMNEMYARDIAVKVRASRKIQWEKGSFIGGAPPYGYRAERTGEKKRLYMEEGTSTVVKKIFHLFVSGKNMTEIAEQLYKEKIARPSEYRKTGKIYAEEGCGLQQWSRGSVKMILTNPVYMGCLVRDKGEAAGVKENTHEAIVSRDVFSAAALKFEQASKYGSKKDVSQRPPLAKDSFSDVLYCGDCGAKMKRISQIKKCSGEKGVRLYSYNCPGYRRIDGQRCVSKSITLPALTRLVRVAVRQECALSAISLQAVTEANNREGERLQKEGERELAMVEKRVQKITRLGSEQYIRYRLGELSRKAFLKAKEENEKKAAFFQKKREEIIERLEAVEARRVWKNHFFCSLIKGSEEAELTAEAVNALIHRIEVYPDQRIKIIFAFKRRDGGV